MGRPGVRGHEGEEILGEDNPWQRRFLPNAGEAHSLTVCKWRKELFDEREQPNMIEEVVI